MPGKSRHDRKKRFHQSKKSRAKQRSGTMPLHPPVADSPQPVASSTPVAAAAPAAQAKAKPAQLYPYIVTELRTIGILAVVILAILIVLALTLS
jgi:hypothetical protein